MVLFTLVFVVFPPNGFIHTGVCGLFSLMVSFTLVFVVPPPPPPPGFIHTGVCGLFPLMVSFILVFVVCFPPMVSFTLVFVVCFPNWLHSSHGMEWTVQEYKALTANLSLKRTMQKQ